MKPENPAIEASEGLLPKLQQASSLEELRELINNLGNDPSNSDSYKQAFFLLTTTLKANLVKTPTLTALLYKEDDIYVAKCPEVGTVSQGKNIEEAVVNLREATELYLEDEPELLEELARTPRPIQMAFEVHVA